MRKSFLFTLLCLLGLGAMQPVLAAKEIYAVTSNEGKTFTIRYDENKSANKGVTPDDWTAYEWNVNRWKVETIQFDPSMSDARPTTLAFWFDDFFSATTIGGLKYLNTSEVTDMTGMFRDCTRLTDIKLYYFNTSKVTKMNGMFNGCKALQSLNVNTFDMSNVTDTRNMFSGCSGLTTIGCKNDWSSLGIAQSTDMFKNCAKLKGENGTVYDAGHLDVSYARPDGLNGKPGYFTAEAPEVYYEIVESGKLVTYYFDNKRDSRTGVTALYDPENDDPLGSDWHNKVKKAVIDESMKKAEMTTMKNLFIRFFEVTTIEGLENLNTANVTDMTLMFGGCGRLTSLDLSSFNTEKVTNMSNMFNNCWSLTSLDLSSFNTANVENMQSMFYGCTSLTSLDLSLFNTSNVENMQAMFYGCTSLTSLDLSSFNTANVTDMSYMFQENFKLTYLDLHLFKTDKLENTYQMFEGCEALTTIYCNDDWTKGKVTSSKRMFQDCKALKGGKGTTYNDAKVDIAYARPDEGTGKPGYFTEFRKFKVTFLDKDGNEIATVEVEPNTAAEAPEAPEVDGFYFKGWDKDFSHVTSDMTVQALYIDLSIAETTLYTLLDDTELTIRYDKLFEAFDKATLLKDITKETRKKVTKVVFDESVKDYELTSLSGFFEDMSQLKKVEGLQNLNTSNVDDMSMMFSGCESLTSLDLSSFNTANLENMQAMFYGCTSLKSLVLSSFNTANVENMQAMFSGCTSLTSLDLSSFNTANVENMQGMFYGCISLTSLDLSLFNTSKVKDMSYMLSVCESLTSLDLSSFNTANVEDMSYMFFGCESLTSLDLSSFNTANVKTMENMFVNCISLKSLNLSRFNTEKVTNMSGMFGMEAENQLEELNLANFQIRNGAVLAEMFYGCTKLKTIYCNYDWSIAKYADIDEDTGDMFKNCKSLVGGNGTSYAGLGGGSIYLARPDGGPDSETPGFFTTIVIPTYTVTFLDWDETLLLKETVVEGHDAKGPEVTPTREGYTFIGWSEPITNITADLTVIAQYIEIHGLDNVEWTNGEWTKVFHNGQLLILRDGKAYTLTGQQVK